MLADGGIIILEHRTERMDHLIAPQTTQRFTARMRTCQSGSPRALISASIAREIPSSPSASAACLRIPDILLVVQGFDQARDVAPGFQLFNIWGTKKAACVSPFRIDRSIRQPYSGKSTPMPSSVCGP